MVTQMTRLEYEEKYGQPPVPPREQVVEAVEEDNGGIADFGKGLVTGALKSFQDAGEGLDQIASKVREASPFGTGSSTEAAREFMQPLQFSDTTATEPGEGTGKFLGTLTQYLAPTGAITKGQQVLGAASKLAPKGLQTISGIAARFLPEAFGTGAVSAVRSGGDLEEAKNEGLLAGGFSVALGGVGNVLRSTYWPQLNQSVTQALGIQGKRSGNMALKDVTTKTAGLQVLKDMADDITVKLSDGTEALFDPRSATYDTTLQAWNSARKNIYDQYSKLSQQAGESATVDLSQVRASLEQTLSEPRLSNYKNAVSSLLKDLDANFDELTAVDITRAEKFLENLNSQTVNSFFQGTSDAVTSEVNAGAAKVVRELLDSVITQQTGKEYQALRSQYAALKSIEDDLVRKFQQTSRSIGGGLPEYMGMFSSGDIVGGLLAGQPGQAVRGGILGALATAKRALSRPERFLRRSFQLIGDEVPSDFTLRLFGGQRALTDDEARVAQDIGESLQSPAGGLSIASSVTPEKVVKNLTRPQFKRILAMLDDMRTELVDPDTTALLKELGLSKAETAELERFLREVVDLAEERGF